MITKRLIILSMILCMPGFLLQGMQDQPWWKLAIFSKIGQLAQENKKAAIAISALAGVGIVGLAYYYKYYKPRLLEKPSDTPPTQLTSTQQQSQSKEGPSASSSSGATQTEQQKQKKQKAAHEQKLIAKQLEKEKLKKGLLEAKKLIEKQLPKKMYAAFFSQQGTKQKIRNEDYSYPFISKDENLDIGRYSVDTFNTSQAAFKDANGTLRFLPFIVCDSHSTPKDQQYPYGKHFVDLFIERLSQELKSVSNDVPNMISKKIKEAVDDTEQQMYKKPIFGGSTLSFIVFDLVTKGLFVGSLGDSPVIVSGRDLYAEDIKVGAGMEHKESRIQYILTGGTDNRNANKQYWDQQYKDFLTKKSSNGLATNGLILAMYSADVYWFKHTGEYMYAETDGAKKAVQDNDINAYSHFIVLTLERLYNQHGSLFSNNLIVVSDSGIGDFHGIKKRSVVIQYFDQNILKKIAWIALMSDGFLEWVAGNVDHLYVNFSANPTDSAQQKIMNAALGRVGSLFDNLVKYETKSIDAINVIDKEYTQKIGPSVDDATFVLIRNPFLGSSKTKKEK